MAGEPIITITGNVVRPELRFTGGGKAVFSFTVADTPRVKKDDKWEDGTTTWWPCVLFGAGAENAGNSVEQGDRVIVQGRCVTETWQDKESGANRSRLKLMVEEMGASLKFREARIIKADRQGQGASQAQTPDPWGSANVQQQMRTGGMGDQWASEARNGFSDNPPF